MGKKYEIKPLFLLVRDVSGTKFHIKNDDYFGTVATILNLIGEDIKKGESTNRLALIKTLNSVKKDLLFLQKNYQINPKIKNRKNIPNGKLINQ